MTTPSSPASNRVEKIRLMLDAAEREDASGATLLELERRQDDVLSQLEELDQKLTNLLRGLGVTFVEEEAETSSIRLATIGDEDESDSSSIVEDVVSSDELPTAANDQLKRRRAA